MEVMHCVPCRGVTVVFHCRLQTRHQQSPGKICCATARCSMLHAAGGGYPNFPKAMKVANPQTKHKGMHLPPPCKDEHNRIVSWVVMLLHLFLIFPLLVLFIDIHDCHFDLHPGCLYKRGTSPMPSPIAHCKQSVVLVVVSLFLLGCAVPSSLSSTVDIRRRSEENNDLSKQSTAKKGGVGTG